MFLYTYFNCNWSIYSYIFSALDTFHLDRTRLGFQISYQIIILLKGTRVREADPNPAQPQIHLAQQSWGLTRSPLDPLSAILSPPVLSSYHRLRHHGGGAHPVYVSLRLAVTYAKCTYIHTHTLHISVYVCTTCCNAVANMPAPLRPIRQSALNTSGTMPILGSL